MRARGRFVTLGVASYDADAVVLDPQPVGKELGIARLVPLPGRQRADLDLDRAFRPNCHHRFLVRRAALRFDIGAEPDAPIASVSPRFITARRKPVPIRQRQSAVEDRLVGTAVIGHPERVGIRQRVFGDQVAAAQRHAVEAELAGGAIDQPLHHKHHLGAAGAAIGRGRDRVAEHRALARARAAGVR